MPLYIGQNLPNYQQQIPGPEPGIGLLPARKGQYSRGRFTAPMPVTNQLFPQQHIYSYRDDPSGAGPGGKEVNTPPARPMGLLHKLLLPLLLPPRNASRLPVAPWNMINSTSEVLFERLATGVEQE